MPSPFPGMDPYLENPARWTDMHQRLITYIADALQPHLRPRYHACMGERVYVMLPPRTMYPDVLITRHPLREAAVVGYPLPNIQETVALWDTPIVVTLPAAEHREPYIELVHTAGDEVVTIIEVLSPANKADGEGRDQYRRKQQTVLESAVHLVEIDLLSSGLHSVAAPIEVCATLPPHRYLVSVWRGPELHHFELYPAPLQERLPRLRVPLRAPDPDVGLDLGGVLGLCYDNGGYADLIDYRQPPPVPLSAEETAWVDGLLQGKGLR